MAIQPIEVRRDTLADTAYRQLFEAFLNGDLEPGSRLVMDQLADRMGISRTPVREALQRLERERVIEPSGRRGYLVRQLSDLELDQRYQAREAIESYALELVTQRGGIAAVHVRATFDRLSDAPQTTPTEVYLVNKEIHRCAIEALENPYLLEMFDMIWNAGPTSSVWADILAHEVGVTTFADDHRLLVEAVESGDPAAARRAAIDHIRHGRSLHNM